MGGTFDADPPESTDRDDVRPIGDGSGSELDRVCTLLGDRTCRYVLYYLQECDDEVVSIDDVVDAIQEWESTDAPASVRRERIEVDLKHNHLPRLADHDVLEYDARSDTIRYRDELFARDWFESLKEDELETRR